MSLRSPAVQAYYRLSILVSRRVDFSVRRFCLMKRWRVHDARWRLTQTRWKQMTHAVVLCHENHLSFRREEVCHVFVKIPAEECVSVSIFDGGVVCRISSRTEHVGGVGVYQSEMPILSGKMLRCRVTRPSVRAGLCLGKMNVTIWLRKAGAWGAMWHR